MQIEVPQPTAWPTAPLLDRCEAPARRVVVVEDDVELELPIRRAMRELDPAIRVEWFVDASQVYWEVCRRPYDLVVADVRLPGGTSGVRLWRLCHLFLPQLPFLLMSATRTDRCLDMLGSGGPPFLPKPFSLETFKACVQGVLSGPRREWRRRDD
jgi:DNA-binding NtrC family response regulator